MRCITLLAPALSALLALAAPTHERQDLRAKNGPASADALSQYFNLLAEKVQTYKVLDGAPKCDLGQAVLPTSSDPLPAPDKGHVVKHVALGRGTQNYTCDATDPSAAPVLAGAVATLFDASCLSSTHPDVLSLLSRLAISYHPSPSPLSILTGDPALPEVGAREGVPELGPSALGVSGMHYFTADGVPFFTLDRIGAGHIAVGKNASVPAPSDAAVGLQGEKAVGWLRLLATEDGDKSGGLEEVYRVDTVGGSAPATCEGLDDEFTVDYVAQYWFMGTE